MGKTAYASSAIFGGKVYGAMPKQAGFKNRGYQGLDPEDKTLDALYPPLDENDDTDDDDDSDDLSYYLSGEIDEYRLATVFGPNWEYRL